MSKTWDLSRHREAWERHYKRGEAYKSIGEAMGVSEERVRQMAGRWEQEIRMREMREEA